MEISDLRLVRQGFKFGTLELRLWSECSAMPWPIQEAFGDDVDDG